MKAEYAILILVVLCSLIYVVYCIIVNYNDEKIRESYRKLIKGYSTSKLEYILVKLSRPTYGSDEERMQQFEITRELANREDNENEFRHSKNS